MPIHSDSPAGDLSRLRIDRDTAPRRRWLPWAVLVVLGLAGVAVYPSARARVKVAEAALENTNVRAPFDGVVVKKRAEMGETVSPFGVQGQASREGGAIATIADLGELEVQTEVSENSVAKLTPGMPAEVKLKSRAA